MELSVFKHEAKGKIHKYIDDRTYGWTVDILYILAIIMVYRIPTYWQLQEILKK